MWSNKKFLFIRFSSIGDIVLATPAIRCLKTQLPGAEVHFLTKRSFKAVTEANPYIDQFHYYDNNLIDLITQLNKEKFDLTAIEGDRFLPNIPPVEPSAWLYDYPLPSVANILGILVWMSQVHS